MSEPLPPVPNVLKSVIEGATSFGRNWFTIFHWLYTGGPPTSANLTALANDILAFYNSAFVPLMPPSTTTTACQLTDLSTAMMPSVTFDLTTPGTSTADKLPANCAMLYNYNVSMRYRGGHPRNYIYAGTDENLLNESQWNSAFVTSANTAMSEFVAAVLSLTVGSTHLIDQVMVSYFGGAPTVDGKSVRRSVPLVLNLAPGLLNQIVGSQRRRLGRRG